MSLHTTPSAACHIGGITSDFCLWIDAFEQFAGRLVIRVLRYKFAVNGKVKNFLPLLALL